MAVSDRPRHGWRLVVAPVLGLLLLGTVVWSMILVARPATSAVRQADAVAVYASSAKRLDAGLGMVEAGTAPVLVLSVPGAQASEPGGLASPAYGPAYGRSAAEIAELCHRREPYEVICVAPRPVSTVGEARAFGAVVEPREWQSVAVVTDRGHLARAAQAMRQCTGAEVLAVARNPRATPRAAEVFVEWVKFVATATFMRAC